MSNLKDAIPTDAKMKALEISEEDVRRIRELEPTYGFPRAVARIGADMLNDGFHMKHRSDVDRNEAAVRKLLDLVAAPRDAAPRKEIP